MYHMIFNSCINCEVNSNSYLFVMRMFRIYFKAGCCATVIYIVRSFLKENSTSSVHIK